jgi:hypothetical protein
MIVVARPRQLALAALAGIALFVAAPKAHAGVAYGVRPVTDLTAGCGGGADEIEQATDPALGYVYEEFMGCGSIYFARSTDGGATFSRPLSLPASASFERNAWDPAVAVSPTGIVYAVFMTAKNNQWYPVVDASYDHGQSFPQTTYLTPPDFKNWGDRPFVAVGPDGAVYITWDYGPNRTSVTFLCAPDGSCGYASGDVNVVIQKSTDNGKTFGPMHYVSPGFPASGGDLAPLLVEPNGRIDALYQGYKIIDSNYDMEPAVSYFTSSSDGGTTWTPPVAVDPQAGTMSLSEWWIDDSISIDGAGNLYAAWDTQGTSADGSANDIGWLAYSTNHGKTWSPPIQAPVDTLGVPHLIEVQGGPGGIAYVAWLSDSDPLGYALYLRTYSIAKGWLSSPVRVSPEFGDPSIWPGDTFGIDLLTPTELALSWGSATPSAGKKSDDFATTVNVALR